MINKIKKGVLSFLDSHTEEQIQFVIDLCNQNSFTYNKKGVDSIGEMIFDQLNGILPIHQVIKQNEIGNIHLLKNTSSSKAIYLVGHMDTVFPPDHPFQKCQIQGDLLKGPGTGDMKGGLAVFVYALKAIKEVNLLDKLNLVFILNSDEEIGSTTSHSIFIEERKKAIACLVAECAGHNGEVVTSRNGKMGARIDCIGQDRHVGFGTHEKASAILELAHKIVSLESLNASLPGISLNIGKIEGGLGPCTIPGYASCLLDIRWVEEEHQEILLNKICTEIAHSSQPGCHSELKILNSRPAMPLKKGTQELFQIIQQVSRHLTQKVNQEHRRGTSDANFFGAVGVPTLDGLGPIGEKDHTPEEFIKISSLKERSALLALFLIEYGLKAGKTS